MGGQQPFLAVELHGEALGESLQHKDSAISCHAAKTLASSALEVEEPGIVELGGGREAAHRPLNDACLQSASRRVCDLGNMIPGTTYASTMRIDDCVEI